MPGSFQLEQMDDGVVRLTFDQPGSKVNTLGHAVVAELEQALSELEARPGLAGLILTSGKPGAFIAGADLKELAAATPNSDLARGLIARGLGMIARFEKLACPTVALIDGPCMGGGTELVLGFDYRLMGTHPKADIGLPETKIGLIPGWGGTQRLTRAVGPSLAAEMICSGEPASPARAREIGLVFDVVPSEKLTAEALRLLRWARESGDYLQQRRRKQQPIGLSEEQATFAFAVARAQVLAKTRGAYPAPLAALDAIERGCNRTLDEGLAAETENMLPLVGSTISRNLISIFFMNQRLQKDPGVCDASVTPRKVERVGVVGAGIMGAGIATAHLRRGIPTTLVDVAAPALQKGVGAIVQSLQGRVAAGRMKADEVAPTMALLNATIDTNHLARHDLVIEAVIEKEAIKTELFRTLEPLLAPEAVLASNTSTISITRMAQALSQPERFAGLHFFNPVDRMQLVEVIRGEKTSDATVATLVAHAKKLGKSPIVVKDGPGFLVNRILFPYLNEAFVLLEEGASPRQIDQAALNFGMPMGPLALSDVVGLDTCLYAGSVVNQAYADRAVQTRVLAELVKAGRLGQKTGAGFYSYARGSRGSDDPALAAFLPQARKDFTAEELTDRLILPMLVEASRVLSEGLVRDPADVDLGLLLGIGFPAFRGGLLRWADTEGPDKILARLAKYAPLGKRYEATDALSRPFYR